MARIALTIDTKKFDDLLWAVEKMGVDAKKAAEKALAASFDLVTQKAETAMGNRFLPAHGKYSTGRTLDALCRDPEIVWTGDVASCRVGFDIKKGGLASIFLMYGTPKMAPDQRLYDAFKSKATEREVYAVQEDALMELISQL